MSQSLVLKDLEKYGPQSLSELKGKPLSQTEANSYCENLARKQYENFTVVSWLLATELKPHFYAIYAFCRWADDLADEIKESYRRKEMLRWWRSELAACYRGRSRHPVFIALTETIEQFLIPNETFERLITAFEQDQIKTRYASHEEVIKYCGGSANPVGELVLYVGSSHSLETVTLSDSVCTGLQLANFCQDVARDWKNGRLYLPLSTLRSHNLNEQQIASAVTNPKLVTPDLRAAVEEEVLRAEAYLKAGMPLAGKVRPSIQLEVDLFIHGGLAICEAIRKQNFDVWGRRPTVTKWQKFSLFLAAKKRRKGRR